MKTHFLYLAFFLIVCSSILRAQEVSRCGTWEYFQLQQQGDSSALRRWNAAKEAAHYWLETNPASTRTVITIPVIVHVVYNTETQNISDAQIRSQIDVLNDDFSLSNIDTSKIPAVWKSVASSLAVKFCLAASDPDGNPTTGIERIQTSITEFDVGDISLKHTQQGGATGWPSDSYLNIWVCNLGGGVLGYTTLPGTASLKEDGIVVRYNAFGRRCNMNPPYNLGRTATHELGHWFGLVHTWGDDGGSCNGSDGMGDTPNEGDATYGCHTFPLFDNCATVEPGVMFMNYMDYSDDACLYMFTHDQTQEMLAVMSTSRVSLLNSLGGCQSLYHLDAALSAIGYPDDTLNQQSFQGKVQLSNRGSDEINSIQIDYQVDGQSIQHHSFTGALASGTSTVITLPTSFTGEYGHSFVAWCYNPNGGNDEFVFNDTTCGSFFVQSTVPKNTIIASPNPASDQLQITFANPSDATGQLQLVNMLGQMVDEINVPLTQTLTATIDASNLSNGIYIIYAHIGYDYVKQKVLVLHQ